MEGDKYESAKRYQEYTKAKEKTTMMWSFLIINFSNNIQYKMVSFLQIHSSHQRNL